MQKLILKVTKRLRVSYFVEKFKFTTSLISTYPLQFNLLRDLVINIY